MCISCYFLSTGVYLVIEKWKLFAEANKKAFHPLHKKRVRHEGQKYVRHEGDFKLGSAANFGVSGRVLVTNVV